ncbi:MAG: DUF2802 domain-containing protein [Thiobacillus sp.]|nr:DUF2802 domain-containing protein [Thiobacillus sp.]
MMLEQINFTGRELLIAVILATLVYVVETLIFARRKSRDTSSFTLRIDALERELAGLKARLEHLEVRPPAGSAMDGQSTIYAEAVRLARNGVQPRDMADQLGISRSEAELIVALHKEKQ